MKTSKLIKILALSLVVNSGVLFSFSLVSCGHKDNTPAYSWGDFKESARKEEAINIVKVTNPNMWSNAKADQLHIENFKADDKTETITINIIRNIPGYGITKGKFNINNKNDYKYDVQDWECLKEPKTTATGWELYKVAATDIHIDDLLNKIAPWANTTKYKWPYGTEEETTWAKGEEAEWDVYGALPGGGDAYKGMAGKPTVIESPKKIITAIISKKGKDGAFDSDPIKATISTYKLGSVYNINDWVFTIDTQLQSFNKVSALFNNQVQETGNWTEFNSHNWMTLDDNNSGNAHPSSPDSIADVLQAAVAKRTNDPSVDLFLFSCNGTYPFEIVPNDSTTYGCKVEFDFESHTTFFKEDWQIQLFFYFHLANGKDKSGGGTAFNYIWAGDLRELPPPHPNKLTS